jgi:hypothetical protein
VKWLCLIWSTYWVFGFLHGIFTIKWVNFIAGKKLRLNFCSMSKVRFNWEICKCQMFVLPGQPCKINWHLISNLSLHLQVLLPSTSYSTVRVPLRAFYFLSYFADLSFDLGFLIKYTHCNQSFLFWGTLLTNELS